MYKNNEILKRNAFGERIYPKDEERIRKAVKLHNINRKIIAKIEYFDRDIQSSICLYLSYLFENIKTVEIHSDSLWVDTNHKGLTLKELSAIEEITGYPYEREIDFGYRYIFTIQNESIDHYTGRSMFPDETKRVQDYIELSIFPDETKRVQDYVRDGE